MPLKRPQLASQAKEWKRLWSIRLAVAAAVFAALEASLPLWDGIIHDGVFAAVSTICGVGAAIARVIRQTAIEGPADGN